MAFKKKKRVSLPQSKEQFSLALALCVYLTFFFVFRFSHILMCHALDNIIIYYQVSRGLHEAGLQSNNNVNPGLFNVTMLVHLLRLVY